jgi:hypothetical protein
MQGANHLLASKISPDAWVWLDGETIGEEGQAALEARFENLMA